MDVQEKATEVKSRVPIDGSTEDWSSKSIKDLMQAYDDYTALIRAYESEYIKEDGSFDLDALKRSADWDKYEQIVNYILPTIINKLVSTTDSEANNIKESLKDYGSGNILKMQHLSHLLIGMELEVLLVNVMYLILLLFMAQLVT